MWSFCQVYLQSDHTLFANAEGAWDHDPVLASKCPQSDDCQLGLGAELASEIRLIEIPRPNQQSANCQNPWDGWHTWAFIHPEKWGAQVWAAKVWSQALCVPEWEKMQCCLPEQHMWSYRSWSMRTLLLGCLSIMPRSPCAVVSENHFCSPSRLHMCILQVPVHGDLWIGKALHDPRVLWLIYRSP